MSLEKCSGLVIRQVDFSESSRVVTFYSREFGRFSAMAKGAKRLKGPFDAALDLLSECRLVFIRKSQGTLNLLTEARLSSRFQPQFSGGSDGVLRLYSGYYLAELLNSLNEDFDPNPELYDQAIAGLSQLTQPGSEIWPVVIWQELTLLQLSGLLPNLQECSICGSSTDSVDVHAHWVSQGGLICGECRREEYQGNLVRSDSLEILGQLCDCTAEEAATVRLDRRQIQECHQFAVSAVSGILGRRPKTLRYLQLPR